MPFSRFKKREDDITQVTEAHKEGRQPLSTGKRKLTKRDP